MRLNSRRARGIALLYGAACHAIFGVAVTVMALSIYGGMQVGLGPFRGVAALMADLLLVLQFPILHSALLDRRGRRWLAKCAPAALRDDLATTLYSTFASLQLLVLFGLWSPISPVIWQADGATRWILQAAFAFSWALLMKSMLDAGLGLQTGFLGWWAVFRGRRPAYGPFPTGGLFRLCRQPIYASFALITWTGPDWSADRLLLAIPLTAYCVVGPLLKEARYAERHGEAFHRYQERVPYILPRLPYR